MAPGFYIAKNITVHGVDRRQFWSNGMFVRTARGLGPKLSDGFKTETGVVDRSSPGNLKTVCFPGSYQFEGPSSPVHVGGTSRRRGRERFPRQVEEGFPRAYY